MKAGVAMRRETVRRENSWRWSWFGNKFENCATARSARQYKASFLELIFAVEEEHDVLWKPGERTSPNPSSERVPDDFRWCLTRIFYHRHYDRPMSNPMIEHCMGGHEPCEVMREHLHAWLETASVDRYGGGFADVDVNLLYPRGVRIAGE